MSGFTHQATDQFAIGLRFHVLRFAHLAGGFGNQLPGFHHGHIFAGTTAAIHMIARLLTLAQDQRRAAHHAFVQWNTFIAMANNMVQRACLAQRHKVFTKCPIELTP